MRRSTNCSAKGDSASSIITSEVDIPVVGLLQSARASARSVRSAGMESADQVMELDMRRLFGNFVLVAVGLFFLYTAWSSGTAPRQFAELLGLNIVNADGLNEIRAQYGGFFLAAAGICAASLIGAIPRQIAYTVIAVTSGGCITGRLVSLVLNGGFDGYSPIMLGIYFIDSTVFISSIVALILDRSSGASSYRLPT